MASPVLASPSVSERARPRAQRAGARGRRPLGRALAVALGALALGLVGFGLGIEIAELLRPVPAPVAGPLPHVSGAPPLAPPAPPLPVRFLGNAGARTREALARVLATGVGVRARRLMESGALPGPVTIVVNDRGDHFTRYRIPGRELGETIVFDPLSLPLVETEEGPLPALPETVLAHELGHAVFKLVDEEAVIEAIENPIRDDLGLPRRVRF